MQIETAEYDINKRRPLSLNDRSSVIYFSRTSVPYAPRERRGGGQRVECGSDKRTELLGRHYSATHP